MDLFRLSSMSIFKRLMLLLLCVPATAYAQQYGFEWIRTYQPYYKFEIGATGVYRIPAAALQASGVNINTINPKKIQVFYQGKEVPIYIAGESDEQFNNEDFIELLCFKNNGDIDTLLYQQNDWQPHRFTGLFTDTSAYFLTILPDTSIQLPKRLRNNYNQNFTGLQPELYFMDTTIVAPAQEYLDGPDLMNASEKYVASEYESGEGWAGERSSWFTPRVYRFRTPARFLSGPNPKIEYKVVGASNARPNANGVNHHVQVAVSPDNASFSTLSDQIFLGYIPVKFEPNITLSQLGEPFTYLRMSVINDLGVASDFISFSYGLITYPRSYNLAGETSKFLKVLHQRGGSRSFLQFSGAQGNPSSYYILDITGNSRIQASNNSGVLEFAVNNTGIPNEVFIYDSTSVTNISRLKAVNFPQINPLENYEYLVISHPVLEPAAENYATYRSMQFKVLKVYSEQLYDYYFYGNKHPLAVRRFTTHLLQRQVNAPLYLLMAGRGYQNDKARFFSVSSTTPIEYYNRNLVPAIGVPGADALFSNGITGDGFYPDIPTGRVSASTAQELQNYLDKVVEYEMSPDSIVAWRKNVLHISGGGTEREQTEYRDILAVNGIKMQGPQLGASIKSFAKSLNVPTQLDLKDQIVTEQNRGISLVSFYGHASLTILDVDIGSINDLNNNTKYPFYYFSGCNVGNATEVDPLNGGVIYAKDYLCTARKGAIGWVAHSNISFTGFLAPIINTFYTKYTNTSYGESMGRIMNDVCKQLSNGSNITKSHNLQWVLQGDPAVKPYSPSLPDYTITGADIFATNAALSVQDETLNLGIILTNIGRTTNDSISVSVKRTLPNNQVINYPVQKFPKVLFKDTAFVSIEMLGDLALGNNNIEVRVDANNETPEIFENNNTASVNIFVPGNGTKILYPIKDGVVGTDTVLLVVQSNNILSSNNQFIIEIDTVNTFNSPFKINTGVINAGTLLSWPLRITVSDTTTFYWRAKLNLPELQGGRYTNSAFTYIPNHPDAWMQRTFERIIDLNKLNLLVVDTANKKLEFSDNTAILNIYASRFAHAGRGIWYGENQNPGVLQCIQNGFVAILFDQRTLQPFINPRFPLNCQNVINNNNNPSLRKLYYYGFPNTEQGQNDFKRFVDSAEQGTYIAIFSIYNNGNTTWDNNMRGTFARLGSSTVANLNHIDAAFSMVGRIGAPIGSIFEDTLLSYKVDTFTTTNAVLFGKWYVAGASTSVIGPAKEWKKFLYQYDGLEPDGADKNIIKIWGTLANGEDTLLIDQVKHNEDLSMIDANRFPFVKLSFELLDSTYRTPAQINYWMIKYTPVPEGTISIADGYEFYKDELEQGDSMSIKLAFKNISPNPITNLPVKVRIIDENRVPIYTWSKPLGDLAPGSFVSVQHKVSTYNFSGRHGLEVYFNEGPQLELTKTNNYVFKNFNVKPDQINPLLDVTFDGYRIINGDFVSAKPFIKITSKDDSKFKLQQDTGNFALFLKVPGSVDFERIDLGAAAVRFIPATNAENKAAIEFNPEFKRDGLYTLRVMSKDASGNIAGSEFYEIEFNVLQKSTITNFFPYPNPATTNVKFVFTLTGSAPPDQLLIRIMTVSGRIVKEITKDEFGPIRIGQNISEYSWDGTDNFGDRLANGVYLYQVLTRINGVEIERRKTNADQYFVQDVGKIYLMK